MYEEQGQQQQSKDGWTVETDKGSISCEHVISCSGNFARQTGQMVGIEIPAIPPPTTIQSICFILIIYSFLNPIF